MENKESINVIREKILEKRFQDRRSLISLAQELRVSKTTLYRFENKINEPNKRTVFMLKQYLEKK